ncbi:unnamed protein product [Brassica oleracea]
MVDKVCLGCKPTSTRAKGKEHGKGRGREYLSNHAFFLYIICFFFLPFCCWNLF